MRPYSIRFAQGGDLTFDAKKAAIKDVETIELANIRINRISAQRRVGKTWLA